MELSLIINPSLFQGPVERLDEARGHEGQLVAALDYYIRDLWDKMEPKAGSVRALAIDMLKEAREHDPEPRANSDAAKRIDVPVLISLISLQLYAYG